MYEFDHGVFDRVRWLILGIPAVLLMVLVPALFQAAPKTSACVSAGGHSEDTLTVSDSPNVITNGMSAAAGSFMQAMDTAGRSADCGGRSAAAAVSHSTAQVATGLQTGASTAGHAVGSSLAFTAHTAGAVVGGGARLTGRAIGSTTAFTGRTIYSGIALMFYVPNHMLRFATSTRLVSAVIEPAASMPVQTIDPSTTAAVAAHQALPAAAPAPAAKTASQVTPQVQPASAGVWPIHGEITTLFGVPELPYQAIHTGLDISDGKPSGTTPIHAFKAGRVSQVIRGYLGLGNHVVIDHGNGLTSVYGHMYSISVQEGQQVDQSTVLGYEGSTGVSTGTHLHFEIRVNGTPHDPHEFIAGQP